MILTLDNASAVPPFEQIRSQLEDQVRSGALEDGQRLPSIRQLAGDLQLATGTVARAYAQLEAAGLLVTSRGSGTRVRAGEPLDAELRRAAEHLVLVARRRSVALPEALGVVRALWAVPDGTHPT